MKRLWTWLTSKLAQQVIVDLIAEKVALQRSLTNGEGLMIQQRQTMEKLLLERAKLTKQLRSVQEPFHVVYGDAPKWRREDADFWRAFLASEPGCALQAQANFHEQAANRAAVMRTDGDANAFANNTGFARGWHEATRYFFHTLSADIRPEQDDATEPGDEAGRLRERLAS